MSGQQGACGTYAGAQRHQREGTAKCDACKKATAAYMKTYRASGKGLETQRRSASARIRALAKLAQAHPSEYRRLYVQEMNALAQGGDS